MNLDASSFIEVVRKAPLISIDLITKNKTGNILLGLRVNNPARNTWFVPGGRINKDERIAIAFERIARTELGIAICSDNARFIGVFEHFYEENYHNDDFGTHYIVLTYEVELPQHHTRFPSDQHKEFRWWSPMSLLRDPHVHPYTKAYFALLDSDMSR